MKIGYTLSSEELAPHDIIELASEAEKNGFEFLSLSDHFHPWIEKQGQSAFSWSVLGALSQVVKKIDVLTAVTCPIIRYHPVIIAQAAATCGVLFNNRFILGLGTGENLNEHVVGEGWPPIEIRQDMLREAIEIFRVLWSGGYKTYYGNHYSVEDAKIYTLPEKPVPIVYSAFGSQAAKEASRLADGFTTTSPDKKLVTLFKKSKQDTRPIYGQMSVVFAPTREEALKILKNHWPIAGMPKPLNTELRLPHYFENTSKLIHRDDLSEKFIYGRDKNEVQTALKEYEVAGFTHVYIHNIGPMQSEFIKWAKDNILK